MYELNDSDFGLAYDGWSHGIEQAMFVSNAEEYWSTALALLNRPCYADDSDLEYFASELGATLTSKNYRDGDTVMLVPRGRCRYESDPCHVCGMPTLVAHVGAPGTGVVRVCSSNDSDHTIELVPVRELTIADVI